MGGSKISSGRSVVARRKRYLTPWYFMIPCLAFMAYFAIVPTIYVFRMAFMRYELLIPGYVPRFIGLTNFVRVFADPSFLGALRVTFWLSVVGPVTQVLFGLGIALLLMQVVKGRGIITTFLLIPMLIAPSIGGFIFKTLYNVHWGPLNYFLSLIGVGKVEWVAQSRLALFSIWLSHLWVATPFMMILMYAGLSSLPQEVYESAALHSRSAWQTFIHITLPLLKPYIILAIILKFIDSFQGMAHIYVITQGGPGTATENLAFLTYRTALRGFNVATAAALSIVQLGIMLLVIYVLLRVMAVRPARIALARP